MKKRSGRYPRLTVDGHGSSVVPTAGAVLLLRTAEAVGLDAALSQALEPWRRPLAATIRARFFWTWLSAWR